VYGALLAQPAQARLLDCGFTSTVCAASIAWHMALYLATFRRKIDVSGSTVNGFGRAKTAGLPAVFFEGLW
jgi:hypothetical protein